MMLETDNLIIRKPEPGDFERFWGLISDPSSRDYIIGITRLSYGEQLKLFNAQCEEPFSEKGAEFAVISKENRRYIGYCGFIMSPELEGPEFRFEYCRDSWGHGYGLEAGEAVLNYLVKTYGHSAYYARAYTQNVASSRVLDRLGFALYKEGAPNVYKISL